MSSEDITDDLKRFRCAALATRYAGVLFRSKSEAIFARNLELRGFQAWEYEPQSWRTEDGWCPDFWAVKQIKNRKIVSFLIEYKPAKVTDAYLDQLNQRFRSLGDKLHGHFEVLACGNSFNEQRETFFRTETGWKEKESIIGLFRHIEEAARHRYDLA